MCVQMTLSRRLRIRKSYLDVESVGGAASRLALAFPPSNTLESTDAVPFHRPAILVVDARIVNHCRPLHGLPGHSLLINVDGGGGHAKGQKMKI